MDATLNDFLNEINEIAPPIKNKVKECAWQECVDKSTGFPYYWKMSTDEVTWEMPKEYKLWLDSTKSTKPIQDKIPIREPLFSTSSLPTVPENIKIYHLHDESNVYKDTKKVIINKPKEVKSIKGSFKQSSDSEDEKIVLISSYGGDTDSEEDTSDSKSINNGHNIHKSLNSSKSNSRKNSDSEEDEESILEKIQNKAKLLKALGGDVPLSVKTLVSNENAFSLVAGYGNDSDEDDVEASKDPPIAHSTLFPIPQTIDLGQFLEEEPVEKTEIIEEIDTKAFQRKRRIGVSLVNTKRPVEPEPEKDLPAIKSGGIAFVKSDTLNPIIFEKPHTNENESVDEIQVTLKEKLTFLSEGRDSVSPVQVMMIQMETLYVASKAGCLTGNYLKTWLKETCEELIKLELDAAPNGWLLHWDRSQKRYYYKNQTTSECQWDYPKAVEDDAMDICTTPPPPSEEPDEAPVAPPPPRIDSPSTPPAPNIGGNENESADGPLPRFTAGEPLPPGVDPEPQSATKNKSEDLSSVLDSFYSDIAAIENIAPLIVEDKINSVDAIATLADASEPVKKKKRVKMTQGLSMKKKGVSKLVEKWKNVQKDMD